jgi:glycosyltransferase involved in cell wall biosynthesis
MKVTVIAGAIHKALQGVYGSESQSATLAHGFERAGHDVTFIAAAGSEPVGKFRSIPCMYGTLTPNEEVYAYEWYRDELLEQDLIIDWSATHRVTESIYFWDRENFHGVLIWSHQGNVLNSPRPPALHQYHGTVVSQAQKDHGLANWDRPMGWMDPKRLHVVPYGIDTTLYRVPWGVYRKEYFLYLSRPHPHKGIFEFLELAKERPKYPFLMAFDMAAADHRKYGEEAIAKAKDLPNVTYVPLNGSLDLKVKLYQHARALVTPLDKEYVEGFGLVFAEAMACGTPCITATHGGQVDVVGDQGWLCKNREEYLVALDTMMDPERAVEFRISPAKCRDRIVKKFGVDRWVMAYLKLYAKIRRELDTPPWQPLPEWMYQ